jgi:hypothetical protein
MKIAAVSSLFIVALVLFPSSAAATLIFSCGNHSPKHKATTTSEVKSLTKDKGCKDWDVEDTSAFMTREEKTKILKELEAALSNKRSAKNPSKGDKGIRSQESSGNKAKTNENNDISPK